MFRPKSLEEKVLELKQQNSELVQTAQFWRVQYKKMEEEKLSVIKENTELNIIQQRLKSMSQKKKQYFHKIKKRCDTLNELACRSMKDLLQLSSHIEDLTDFIGQCNETYDANDRPSSINLSSSNSPSNVHHVRPMIQGVILKTPILRVSKTNIDSINQFGLKLISESTPTSSPTNQKVTQGSPPCIGLQKLSVTLNRIDSQIERETSRMEEEEMESVNNSYEDESSDFLKYSSRLECIIEESESDHIAVSSKKSDNNVSKNATKKMENSMQDIDDPLEGPSWKFNETYRTSGTTTESPPLTTPVTDTNSPEINMPRLNFVTSRKKVVQDESLFDTSLIQKDIEQIPDSTTDLKETESIYDNGSNPYHSTPINCTNSEKTDRKLPETHESPVIEIHLENEKIETEVAKPKTLKKGRKVSKRIKKTGGQSSPKTQANKSNEESTPRTSKTRGGRAKKSDLTNTSASEEIAVETYRPKRGIRKNYKDPNLHKKLRRS